MYCGCSEKRNGRLARVGGAGNRVQANAMAVATSGTTHERCAPEMIDGCGGRPVLVHRLVRPAPELSARSHPSRPTRPWLTAIAVSLFVAGVAVVARRTWRGLVVPGDPGAAAWGMLDFRDAIYYPVVALLDGNNPYDARAYLATYPVGNAFVLYTPMTLLVHLPFGFLPFVPSAVAYFVASVALLAWLARVTFRMCGIDASVAAILLLAFAMVISQPGQWNLYLGQCGALVTIAAYGALQLARRRPWVAGLCLSVAAVKPATGIPLALLMLAAGESLAVVVGAASAVLIGGIPLIPIVRGAGGIGPFVASLHGALGAFTANPAAAAATSPYRIDLAAEASRLLGWSIGFPAELAVMLAVLAASALALRRLAARTDDDARLLAWSLMCVAVLLCAYHPSNEAFLLALPVVMAGRRCLADGAASPLEWVLLIAAALPAVNYLLLGGVVARMHPGGIVWLMATSLSGAALLIAFAALCRLAWSDAHA